MQKVKNKIYLWINSDDDYWVNVSSQGRETTFYLSAKEVNNFEIHEDGIHLNGKFLTNHFY